MPMERADPRRYGVLVAVSGMSEQARRLETGARVSRPAFARGAALELTACRSRRVTSKRARHPVVVVGMPSSPSWS